MPTRMTSHLYRHSYVCLDSIPSHLNFTHGHFSHPVQWNTVNTDGMKVDINTSMILHCMNVDWSAQTFTLLVHLHVVTKQFPSLGNKLSVQADHKSKKSLTSCSVQACTLSSFPKLGSCLETMELLRTLVFLAVLY